VPFGIEGYACIRALMTADRGKINVGTLFGL
jgi:hypothetical protein